MLCAVLGVWQKANGRAENGEAHCDHDHANGECDHDHDAHDGKGKPRIVKQQIGLRGGLKGGYEAGRRLARLSL